MATLGSSVCALGARQNISMISPLTASGKGGSVCFKKARSCTLIHCMRCRSQSSAWHCRPQYHTHKQPAHLLRCAPCPPTPAGIQIHQPSCCTINSNRWHHHNHLCASSSTSGDKQDSQSQCFEFSPWSYGWDGSLTHCGFSNLSPCTILGGT